MVVWIVLGTKVSGPWWILDNLNAISDLSPNDENNNCFCNLSLIYMIQDSQLHNMPWSYQHAGDKGEISLLALNTEIVLASFVRFWDLSVLLSIESLIFFTSYTPI